MMQDKIDADVQIRRPWDEITKILLGAAEKVFGRLYAEPEDVEPSLVALDHGNLGLFGIKCVISMS